MIRTKEHMLLPYPESVLEQEITSLDSARLVASAAALELAAADAGDGSLKMRDARHIAIKRGIPSVYVDEAIRQGLYLPSLELADAFEGAKFNHYAKVRKWADYFMRKLDGLVIRDLPHRAGGVDLELYLRVRRGDLDLDVCEAEPAPGEEHGYRLYHLTAVRGFRRLKEVECDGVVGYGRRFSPLRGTKLYINAEQHIFSHDYVPFRDYVSTVFGSEFRDVRHMMIIRHVLSIPRIVEGEVRKILREMGQGLDKGLALEEGAR